jgi:hypothetical protein
MTSVSSRFTPLTVQALLDPAVIPENGEVSLLEASSIALCTLFSWELEVTNVLGDVLAFEVRGDSPSVLEAAPLTRASPWWVAAPLACSKAKIANDAITTRQITSDAKRNNPTMEDLT